MDTMTNPTETLNELWELSGEGDAEWWPAELDLVTTSTHKYWVYGVYEIADQHALAIVRDAVEGWLDSLEWKMYRSNGVTKYCPPITGQYYSLPDAVRYAMESTTA